ncbi:endonuclease/exonuclease/phosphatase family protein [Luedemannella helvata]|uniref:Endonuclease/exonuclease/phosphatase family protein n=1 Tax=Luedemannella helvata TaxID=349315 RepID=A0ABP4W360_9ACTN
MADAPTVRVVSYNIHGQRDDRRALVEVVRGLAPDILLVQEGPRRLRWRAKCADLANRCRLVYAAGGLPALGNVALVGLGTRVLESWCLRYPLTPGRHLRGAVFARCRVRGVEFLVAGTHLATDPVERPGQARLLREALDGQAGPVVLAGDLNEGPDGSSWRTLAEGYVDLGEALTFPAAAPRSRIDAVLAGPGVRVVGHRVLDTPLARRASDHLPVVADLVIEG